MQKMGIIHSCLTMFDADINIMIFHPITLKDLQVMMKSFAHDKIPRPDGWTIDLFLQL